MAEFVHIEPLFIGYMLQILGVDVHHHNALVQCFKGAADRPGQPSGCEIAVPGRGTAFPA